MPVVIRQQSTELRLDALEARLSRMESVFSISGSLGIHSQRDIDINIEGSVRIKAGKEIKLLAQETTKICGGPSVIEVSSVRVGVTTGGSVQVDGERLTLNFGQVTANAAMFTVSGTFKSDTVITNTVVAATYTPGAGNIF